MPRVKICACVRGLMCEWAGSQGPKAWGVRPPPPLTPWLASSRRAPSRSPRARAWWSCQTSACACRPARRSRSSERAVRSCSLRGRARAARTGPSVGAPPRPSQHRLPHHSPLLIPAKGSGKSTVVGLVERYYDPAAGSVTLDGQDLRRLNLSWLRSQVRCSHGGRRGPQLRRWFQHRRTAANWVPGSRRRLIRLPLAPSPASTAPHKSLEPVTLPYLEP